MRKLSRNYEKRSWFFVISAFIYYINADVHALISVDNY